MNIFTFVRPLIFSLPPEMAHHCAISALKYQLLPPQPSIDDSLLKQHFWGMTFSNPIGLAAGFDKNAEAIDGLAKQGFGFMEVGTVTPQPQQGNPKPRLFRLTEDKAIINRMGFNNNGADRFAQHIATHHSSIPLGINIGRNATTTDEIADYCTLLKRFHHAADYITINISSPNTQGLRALQSKETLSSLLDRLVEIKYQCETNTQRFTPLLLKIAPDLSDQDIEDIVTVTLEKKLDGLIITNTSIQRPDNLKSRYQNEKGGLSGRPIRDISLGILKRAYTLTKGTIPLIGVGGISDPEDAYQRICHGASLIQLYTALIYHGFSLIPTINRHITARLKEEGYVHIGEAVGKAI